MTREEHEKERQHYEAAVEKMRAFGEVKEFDFTSPSQGYFRAATVEIPITRDEAGARAVEQAARFALLERVGFTIYRTPEIRNAELGVYRTLSEEEAAKAAAGRVNNV